MNLPPKEEMVVDWAVGVLKDAEAPQLSDAFYERMSIELACEEIASPAKLVIQSTPWSKLIAALVLLAALSALWLFETPGPERGPLLTSAEGLTWQVGGTLESSRLAQLTFSTKDAKLQLSPSSEAVLNEWKVENGRIEAEVQLTEGTLFVEEEQSKIAVVTDRVRVIPVGTRYTVSKSADALEVSVLSGQVNVEFMDGSEPVRVGTGETVQVDGKKKRSAAKAKKIAPQNLQRLENRYPKAKKKRQTELPLASAPKAKKRALVATSPRRSKPKDRRVQSSSPKLKPREKVRSSKPARTYPRARPRVREARTEQPRPNQARRRPSSETKTRIQRKQSQSRPRVARKTTSQPPQTRRGIGYDSPKPGSWARKSTTSKGGRSYPGQGARAAKAGAVTRAARARVRAGRRR